MTATHALSGDEIAISVALLEKRYGSGTHALCGVDLDVQSHAVFAFLGPNGAGKTTFVEILEGFRSRTAGSVRVLGEDPATAGRGWRARVGVVPQDGSLEPELTARELIAFHAGLYPDPLPVDEALELVGMGRDRKVRCARLSGGQRRRVEVALALVGRPDLVFLDEPTAGFDPAARRSAWEVLAGLRELGTTIFLTTHYLEEAEALADRIAVIVGGQIVASGTPADLGGRDRAPAVIAFTARPDKVALLPPLASETDRQVLGPSVRLEAAEPLGALRDLAHWTERVGATVHDLDVRRPSLEDIYLRLIGT